MTFAAAVVDPNVVVAGFVIEIPMNADPIKCETMIFLSIPNVSY